MKRRVIILFGVIIILLTVIIVANKKITGSKEVSGEKINQENIKTLKQENKIVEEASTTDSNIKYPISNISDKVLTEYENSTKNKTDSKQYYLVTKVVDGDTIDVLVGTTTERIRLIGINTPEVVDPRKPVECFGREASAKAHELLENQKVYLEMDETQDNRDKYGRLLRYVFRADGLFYNLEIIKQGYAYEYTYFIPYKYQAEFKAAQTYARENKFGLWADNACAANKNFNTSTSTSNSLSPNSNCNIKGNINSKGEKIYHLPACEYYSKTVINLEQGERWFCSEDEAQAAGWRKAQNCE